MTEYISATHDPTADAQNYGLPPNDGQLYKWQRILAGGGTSEFSEIRMRGPIYDKNGVEILGGGGGGGVLNNYTAVLDPTVNDDSVAGYQVGSEWLNTTSGIFFKARNVAVGVAVWVVDTASTATGQNLVFNGGTVAPGCLRGILMTPTGVGAVGGTDSIAIGDQADANGIGTAIAIGAFSVANQIDTLAIGTTATATATNAIAIGPLATASSANSIAIGNNCRAQGSDSIALGDGAVVDVGAVAAICVGFASNAKANQAICVGHSSLAQAVGSIAIGHDSKVNNVGSTNSICIGEGCQVTNVSDVVLVGQNSTCTGSDSVVVGHDSNSSANFSVAIGDSTNVSQVGGIALGASATVLVAPNPLFALGFGSVDPVTTTTQFARLPVRVAGVNRNLLMRDTDIALGDLPGVNIISPIQGQNLTYNGTDWVNSDIPFQSGSIPSAITAVTQIAVGTTGNFFNTFQIPHETSFYRYCRIWYASAATNLSSMRISIYNGPVNGGGALKCHTNAVVMPAGSAGSFHVFDLQQNIPVGQDLIFTKATNYTIVLSLNQLTAAHLFYGRITDGLSNILYGGSSTVNYITNPPPAATPLPTVSATRLAFVLSNTP